MSNALDYAHHRNTPSERPPRPFWIAIVVALAVCPMVSTAAAVFGCAVAMGSWLSPLNFRDSLLWGLLFGILGGLFVLGLATGLRKHALVVSIVGSTIVAMVSGGSLFCLASIP